MWEKGRVTNPNPAVLGGEVTKEGTLRPSSGGSEDRKRNDLDMSSVFDRIIARTLARSQDAPCQSSGGRGQMRVVTTNLSCVDNVSDSTSGWA